MGGDENIIMLLILSLGYVCGYNPNLELHTLNREIFNGNKLNPQKFNA